MSASVMPSLPEGAERKGALPEFQGRLASLLVSAVRHVIVPDVAFRAADRVVLGVGRVVVPVVAFRSSLGAAPAERAGAAPWDAFEPAGRPESVDLEQVSHATSLPRHHDTLTRP